MLRFSSDSSQFDCKVSIVIEQLRSNQRITVSSVITNERDKFGAFAHYQADSNGVVDLDVVPSTGGTFKGVLPMGLISYVVQLPGQRRGLRLMPKDVTKPLVYHMTVYDGHIDAPFDPKIIERCRVITEADCVRTLLHPTVERLEIKENGLRGTLFIPKDSKVLLPALIDMYGTAGGFIEYRAALMSAHNFIVFHLAYFGVEGLQADYHSIDLEYFEKAINWLLRNPRVIPNRVGVIGLSYGADLATNMAICFPQVKAAVPMNGNNSTFKYSHIRYRGKPMSGFSEVDLEEMDMDDTMVRFATHKQRHCLEDPHCYPVELSNAKFLFIAGGDDLLTPFESSLKMANRLKQFGKGDNCKVLLYPRTGHLIEPPHFPCCTGNWNKSFNRYQLSGGDQPYHIAAQNDFWPKAIEFLRRYVSEDSSKL